jgi:hypothetical protein
MPPMPAKFAATAAAIIDPLTDLLRELKHLRDASHRHRDEMPATTGALLAGTDAFLGLGATAFDGASNRLLGEWNEQLTALDEIVYQTQRCLITLQLATEAADARLVNDYVLERILEVLGPKAIVTDGGDAADSASMSVAQTIADALNSGQNWLAEFLDDGAYLLALLAKVGTLLVEDVWNTLADTATLVRTWASDIYDAYSRWIKQIGNQLATLNTNAPVASDYAMPPGVVATMLGMRYQTHPIQIQLIKNPDGTKTIFITLAGTEGLVQKPNSFLSAVVGAIPILGVFSPYALEVLGDVRQFIAQNKKQFDGTTPNVVIAGHSQGGMVAQDLALVAGANGFRVRDIMLFDAPIVQPILVPYQDYATPHDLVPYLSPLMLSPTNLAWASATEFAHHFLHTAIPGAVNPFTGAQIIPDPGRSPLNVPANHMDLVSPPDGAGANPNWKTEQQWFQTHRYAPTYSTMQPTTTTDYGTNWLGMWGLNSGVPVAPDATEQDDQ